MSKKRSKPRKPPADTPPPITEPEASSAPEAQFSNYLSPVMGCPPNVLAWSRIELYGGLFLSVALQAIPMTALTRSLFSLIVLVAFIDVVWRSGWTHYRQRGFKITGTVIFCLLYLLLVVVLFFRESGAFRLAVLAALTSSKFFYMLFFLAGTVAAILGTKGLSLIADYRRSRKAQETAIRERFRGKKEWLDYRTESEESSHRLHDVMARLNSELGRATVGIKIANLFRRKPTVSTATVWAYTVALLFNRASAKMERHIPELRVEADRFIESTEGHLRVCRENYGKLAAARDYFEAQLKRIREEANDMAKIPPEFSRFKGHSQDLTAAINRQVNCFREWGEILRKLEGHCARMVRLTEARRDRAIDRKVIKPLKQLASSLIDTVEMMAEKKDSNELREHARQLREVERQVEAGQQPDTSKVEQWLMKRESAVRAPLETAQEPQDH